MLKTIRTNFDRQEGRRDRRYALPAITVLLDSGQYPTRNWSLGGFLLPASPRLAVGLRVEGELVLPTRSDTFSFVGEVVRWEPDAIAFRFVEPSAELIAVLDRLIAGRMARRRV